MKTQAEKNKANMIGENPIVGDTLNESNGSLWIKNDTEGINERINHKYKEWFVKNLPRPIVSWKVIT